MLLTEIKRLSASEYRGGKDEISAPEEYSLRNAKPLPGHKDVVYVIRRKAFSARISLLDIGPTKIVTNKEPFSFRDRYNYEFKNEYEKEKALAEKKWKAKPSKVAGKHKVIGEMQLTSYRHLPVTDSPKDMFSVSSVTTDEDYRGKGFGLALYRIALSIAKMTLVAGDSQTPDGRKMWQKLYTIPGVEVFGVIEVESTEDDDSALDAVMQMGGEVVGTKKFEYKESTHFIKFDVEPGKGELSPAIKTKLNKLYTDNYRRDTHLIAKWNP